MPSKRVTFDEETWGALDLLARDRKTDFQALADEAFRDLLKKHGRPAGLEAALRRSERERALQAGEAQAHRAIACRRGIAMTAPAAGRSVRRARAPAAPRRRRTKVTNIRSPRSARTPAFPLPLDTPPMESRLAETLPEAGAWQYEPNWDGFRCLAFKAGDAVELRAKSGKPLGRYFPEVVAMLRGLPARRFVVDGELVIQIESRG